MLLLLFNVHVRWRLIGRVHVPFSPLDVFDYRNTPGFSILHIE